MFWKRTTNCTGPSNAQLIADVDRLELENRQLSEYSIIDRHEIAQQKRTIAELEQKLEEASAQIEALTKRAETAEYMRGIVGKCRDIAEQRANGYGKYTPGAV